MIIDSDFGTDGTDGTRVLSRPNCKKIISNINQYEIPVPSVPSVPVSTINYNQLACVFCNQAIMENDWVQDDFSWNKPAHKKCYDEKKDQLANQDRNEQP